MQLSEKGNLSMPNGKLAMWLFLSTEIMFFTAIFATCMLLRESAPSPGPGLSTWPSHETVHVQPWLGAMNTVLLICSSLCVLFSHKALLAHKAPNARKWLGLTLVLGSAFLAVKSYEYYGKFQHGLLPGQIGESVEGLSQQREKILQANGVAYVRNVQDRLRELSGQTTPENIKTQPHSVQAAYALLQLTLDGKDEKNSYLRPISPGQLGNQVNRLNREFPELHLPPAIPNGNLWASCYFVTTGIHAVHVLAGLIVLLILFIASLGNDFPRLTGHLEVAGLYWHFVDLVWLILYPLLYIL